MEYPPGVDSIRVAWLSLDLRSYGTPPFGHRDHMSDNEEFRDRMPDQSPERIGRSGADDDSRDTTDLDREHAGEPRIPTTNQPLNAAPRPRWSPIIGVVALVAVIAAVFILITWLRYNT